MGIDVTKPVSWGSEKSRLKPVSSATTESSWKIVILLVASLDMILSNTQKKGADQSAQIGRLVCAFFVRKPRRQVFFGQDPYLFLSHDIASGSDIMLCNKIDKH